MNFAKFPFRIVKCANNNFSAGRFKGRISNSLGAQFRQITEKETAARLPLQQWCPRIGGKKLNVPYRRHATLLKLLATAVHGPAVPAVTMKLCTQWGDTTRGGRERCVERRDQNRRKEGEQFRRPNAMTRYIPGMRVYGRMSTILSPLPFDPFFCLSLSVWLQVPPTSTTTCYPPCKCISGNEVRNGNLIPAPFHSIARTSIEWLDIDRVWGYFSEMGLGKNGDQAKFRTKFIVASSIRLTCMSNRNRFFDVYIYDCM